MSAPLDLEATAADGLDIAGILRSEIRRRLAGPEPMEEMSLRSFNELTGLVTKLLRAEAAMVKEARALAKDAQDAAKKLSHAQRRAVIVGFVGQMPPEEREALRGELGW